MWKKIGNFFKKFWTLFRPGLWEFLEDNIEDAVNLVTKVWIDQGKPLHLATFAKEAEAAIKQHFNTNRGSWAMALLALAWDAIKQQNQLD